MTCNNVPPSVQTIGFSYVQSPAAEDDAGLPSIGLAISFDVGECLASHGGCPHSDVPEGSAY
jgi:hypothetical protein